MSTKLFTYRDLLRISRAVTPSRAPGAAIREINEIAFLIDDLMIDMLEAVDEATRIRPFTVPREIVIGLLRHLHNLSQKVGLSLVDEVLNFFGEGET